MKQFNLEEYLKNPSRKVITRNRLPVKIHCTNFNGPTPIIAEINSRYSTSFFENGRHSKLAESSQDLFFAPEKYERWINIYKESKENVYFGDPYFSEKEAKDNINSSANCVATVKVEWEE